MKVQQKSAQRTTPGLVAVEPSATSLPLAMVQSINDDAEIIFDRVADISRALRGAEESTVHTATVGEILELVARVRRATLAIFEHAYEIKGCNEAIGEHLGSKRQVA